MKTTNSLSIAKNLPNPTLVASTGSGDGKLTLWSGSNGVEAIETNGDAIWEGEAGFAETREKIVGGLYSDYMVTINPEPAYYGSECTQADADKIAENLGAMLRCEFPGIQTEIRTGGSSSDAIIGPDAETVEAIGQWIDQNWTKAV